MLTLEQAIIQYGQCENFCKYQGLVVSLEELNQITAWLQELQERRKEPEIIRCSECTYFKDRAVTVGYCERKAMYQYKDYFCKDAERRTDEAKRSD